MVASRPTSPVNVLTTVLERTDQRDAATWLRTRSESQPRARSWRRATMPPWAAASRETTARSIAELVDALFMSRRVPQIPVRRVRRSTAPESCAQGRARARRQAHDALTWGDATG